MLENLTKLLKGMLESVSFLTYKPHRNLRLRNHAATELAQFHSVVEGTMYAVQEELKRFWKKWEFESSTINELKEN